MFPLYITLVHLFAVHLQHFYKHVEQACHDCSFEFKGLQNKAHSEKGGELETQLPWEISSVAIMTRNSNLWWQDTENMQNINLNEYCI